MATALKLVLGGLAALATGLAVLATQAGVFTTVNSSSLGIAMASIEVGAAAERIAALDQTIGRSGVTGPAETTVFAIPKADTDSVGDAAIVPVPRPRSLRERATAASSGGAVGGTPKKNRAASRKPPARGVRVAEERRDKDTRRRFLTLPLPPIIGAYR